MSYVVLGEFNVSDVLLACIRKDIGKAKMFFNALLGKRPRWHIRKRDRAAFFFVYLLGGYISWVLYKRRNRSA